MCSETEHLRAARETAQSSDKSLFISNIPTISICNADLA
jgi:hypothetical protein